MITKLYVDSRHGRGPSNDFSINLPESLSFPKRTIARVSEAIIPNSWYTIDEANDGLYVVHEDNAVPRIRKAYLEHQHYTATQLTTAIQTALVPLLGLNVVAHYDQSVNKIVITNPDVFYIPSEEQLESLAVTGWIDPRLRSCNYILENLTGGQGVPLSSTQFMTTQWRSPGVDISRFHSVYIHSSLADNQVINVNMQRTNILKRVSVSSAPGEKIFDSLSNSHDYSNVSEMNVRHITFSLRDREGNLINLQDQSWSLSIVFDYLE